MAISAYWGSSGLVLLTAMLVSEGASFAAADEDRTDRRPLVKQGHDQCRSMAVTESSLSALRILIAVEEIWDVDGARF